MHKTVGWLWDRDSGRLLPQVLCKKCGSMITLLPTREVAPYDVYRDLEEHQKECGGLKKYGDDKELDRA